MTSKKFLALLDNPAWSALSQQQSTEHTAQGTEPRESERQVGWAGRRGRSDKAYDDFCATSL